MNIIDIYLESLIGYDKDVVKEINVAGAVIIKKGKNNEDLVLLIQRDSEDHYPLFWEIPRGKINPKESILKGLKREVKEETGLDIIPIKFIDKFTYIAEKGRRKSTQYNYLCRMKDPNQKVKISKEHQDFIWIQTMGEIELLCQPEIKKTISRVFHMSTQIVHYPEKNEEILE